MQGHILAESRKVTFVNKYRGIIGLLVGLTVTLTARASLTEQEVAQLGISGTPLTPLGAIRAGNEAGTIPEWDGGLTQPPAGYIEGGVWVDPYEADSPIYTITAHNYQQYVSQLTLGQVEMFKRYPETFKMIVYPSRRSAAYPTAVYENTLKYAAGISKCGGPSDNCLEGLPAEGGALPFPIPKTGHEVAFNTSFRFIAKHYYWKPNSFVVTEAGRYEVTEAEEWLLFPYWMTSSERPSDPYFTRNGGGTWCLGRNYISPTRLSGQQIGGCNYTKSLDFDVYLYLPGQRRVRKAPEIGFYDQPLTGSDGLSTSDTRWGYTMTYSTEWFDWKLLGRQEVLIPYNNYRLADFKKFTFDDIFKKNHINPELIRYELHRLWVVEGTVRPEFRHLSPRRVMYVDEDSWYTLAVQLYDADNNPFRYVELFPMTYYEVPTVFPVGDAHYDLKTGRYATYPYFPREAIDWQQEVDPARFTPQGLRRYGLR